MNKKELLKIAKEFNIPRWKLEWNWCVLFLKHKGILNEKILEKMLKKNK